MTFPTDQPDPYTPIVSRLLKVEDVAWGDTNPNFVVRYRGYLYGDSAEAYDRLATLLKPLDITPLFREDLDRHVVILVRGVVNPRPSNPLTNLVLFLVTLFSVVLTGAIPLYEGPFPNEIGDIFPHIITSLGKGIPFAASILAILLAHEFGHYLAGRYHGAAVSLPYFLPLPFLSPFGTLGAFIQLKEPPKNKRILLDIGVAGPLAGLVVAIPILLLGLYLSEVTPIARVPQNGLTFEGNSILYLLAKYFVFGEWLPSPASYGDVSPVLYWIRFFFTGRPLPLGGMDVMIHPVAWAGWAGLLVTALNLIPAGQLDGGHLIYSLLGRRAQSLFPFLLIGMVLLGTFWFGWFLWAALIFFLSRAPAEPLDQITKLDPQRRFVAILGLIIFILVFIPVPLNVIGPNLAP